MKDASTDLGRNIDATQQTDGDSGVYHSATSTNDRIDAEKNTGKTTKKKKTDLSASMNDLPELPEHYKQLKLDGGDNYQHPIPSLPPVPHHAPPQDSSELLSPWWSEEPPEAATEQEPENSPANNLSHYLLTFQRQTIDTTGKDSGQEKCYLWTKEPQQSSTLLNEIKQANITSSSVSLSHGKQQVSTPSKLSQPNTGLNSQCAMVCLFRESQERKMKKRQTLSPSWNPFYGNWLVVVNSRSALLEHIYETDIAKKDSSDYYTMDIGEELGQAGQYVSNFMTRTFLPVQELGRRYIESWRDGTQLGFFTKFIASAKRGDAFFLLRDSARRILDNNVATSDKKNDDDDHKR